MDYWWGHWRFGWEENPVFTLDFLGSITYLVMEAYIIGGVALVLWVFHLQFLWKRRWRILLGVLIVSAYALPLDAWAVARGWGGFNPAYVSGVYFFGNSLLLEEIIFWLGTSFVTISAIMIFAELERRGAPWWVFPLAVILPLEFFDGFSRPETSANSTEFPHVRRA